MSTSGPIPAPPPPLRMLKVQSVFIATAFPCGIHLLSKTCVYLQSHARRAFSGTQACARVSGRPAGPQGGARRERKGPSALSSQLSHCKHAPFLWSLQCHRLAFLCMLLLEVSPRERSAKCCPVSRAQGGVRRCWLRVPTGELYPR